MHRKRTFTELFNERPEPGQLKTLNRFPVIAILENIRSMHNVGAIFRTADAVRLEAIYLAGYTPEPPRKEIEKTALGATETVPWKKFQSPTEAILAAKKLGFEIWVLEQTTESNNIMTVPVSSPVAVVAGNEVWGVSEEVIRLADKAVEIPQYGHKQSLNVSVAMGITFYTIMANITSELWKP